MPLALPPSLTVPCPKDLRADALELLVRLGPLEEGIALVHETVPVEDLMVALAGDRLVGALRFVRLTKSVGTLWPPRALGGGRARDQTAAGLVRGALSRLAELGAKVAQALPAPDDERARADLERGGLPRVGSLRLMERAAALPPVWPRAGPAIDWRAWSPSIEDEFRAALDASYRGSGDVPELDGARSYDDVIACHQGAGHFDPGLWWLGSAPVDRAPIVLAMVERPATESLELAYLGLAPEARGRGLGRRALSKAFGLANERGAQRLSLSVDARNAKALALYRTGGFRGAGERPIHVGPTKAN